MNETNKLEQSPAFILIESHTLPYLRTFGLRTRAWRRNRAGGWGASFYRFYMCVCVYSMHWLCFISHVSVISIDIAGLYLTKKKCQCIALQCDNKTTTRWEQTDTDARPHTSAGLTFNVKQVHTSLLLDRNLCDFSVKVRLFSLIFLVLEVSPSPWRWVGLASVIHH